VEGRTAAYVGKTRVAALSWAPGDGAGAWMEQPQPGRVSVAPGIGSEWRAAVAAPPSGPQQQGPAAPAALQNWAGGSEADGRASEDPMAPQARASAGDLAMVKTMARTSTSASPSLLRLKKLISASTGPGTTFPEPHFSIYPQGVRIQPGSRAFPGDPWDGIGFHPYGRQAGLPARRSGVGLVLHDPHPFVGIWTCTWYTTPVFGSAQ